MKHIHSKVLPFIGIDINDINRFIHNNNKHLIQLYTDSFLLLKEKQIPFVIFSNEETELEKDFSSNISKYFNLQKDYQIKEEQIIFNHTPMKELAQKYKNNIVLITGLGNIEAIAKSYMFKNFITGLEYADLFPIQVPNRMWSFTADELNKRLNEARTKVEKRLGIKIDKFLKIQSVISLTSDMEWQDLNLVCIYNINK